MIAVDMSYENLESAIESLRDELAQQIQTAQALEARYAKARRDLSAAVSRIDEIQTLINQAESIRDGNQDQPDTTPEYVLAVLGEAERPMRDEEIMSAALDLGWLTAATEPLNTFRTFLSRMVKRGDIERTAPATYQISGARFEKANLSDFWATISDPPEVDVEEFEDLSDEVVAS